MRTQFRKANKYCAFHKDMGPWTNDCRHLKWEIEKLLFGRHLRNLVNGNRPQRENKEENSQREFAPYNPRQREENKPN